MTPTGCCTWPWPKAASPPGRAQRAPAASYFVDAQNPADALLRASAIMTGLHAERVDQVLNSDEFDDAVEADVAEARATYGATGVPFFVVDQRRHLGRAATEAFNRTLEAAWNDRD
ncbi:MAG: DsbA family protein [Micropruina glycogenica]